LSLDQSKQSNSPNGEVTPAVLFLLMPNGGFLVKFCKCQKAVSILPPETKALLEWNYFGLIQSYLAKGKITPVALLPHETK